MNQKTTNIESLSQIQLDAFATIEEKEVHLQKYYNEMMKSEMKKPDIRTKELNLKNPSLKAECIDLDFILSNKEDLDYIINQSRRSYYLSYLYIYFELETIENFLKTLNPTPGILADISIKHAGAYSKLFLRGEGINDLGRAMIITETEDKFIKELNKWVNQNPYDYWVEDDQCSIRYRIYLYHTEKRYKGRILPYEIQINKPKLYFFDKESGDHGVYETSRHNSFKSCVEIYKKHDVVVDVFMKELCNNNIISSYKYENFCVTGSFFEEMGAFRINNSGLEDAKLDFVEARGAPGGLKVVNGILHLAESAYYWTQNQFSTEKDYAIRGEVYLSPGGSNLIFGIGPNQEYHGQGDTKSWTFMISLTELWIRNDCFNETLYFANKNKFPEKRFFPFEIRIINKVLTLSVNSDSIDHSFNYPYPDFRLGIIVWDKQPATFLRKLQMEELIAAE